MAETNTPVHQPQGDSLPPDDITPVSEEDSLRALEPTTDKDKEEE